MVPKHITHVETIRIQHGLFCRVSSIKMQIKREFKPNLLKHEEVSLKYSVTIPKVIFQRL